jgi:hypothetical protein
MYVEMVMQELEALGKKRTKKMYGSNGANELLFGVAALLCRHNCRPKCND